jgi:phosphonoacetate hydrolase
VVHHGALGSFATVYLYGPDPLQVAGAIRRMTGIDLVLERKKACARFELPEDRMGELVVISGGARATKVIGTSAGRHDLSALSEPLRSHGGLSEQEIPIITNRKATGLSGHLRNFDAFAIGCNHLARLAEAAE